MKKTPETFLTYRENFCSKPKLFAADRFNLAIQVFCLTEY